MANSSPCRLCGIPRGIHAQCWTPTAGWHRWNAPIRHRTKETAK